ncbi:Chitinase 1 [Escovopsis weberi]|uniref:chitinase n=1 Tax=Escovopsis weberi TaxID=150374 RepID=A0A0M8N1W4_ESCWE|nr:Chitinase 1 [Escovopsis weberi]
MFAPILWAIWLILASLSNASGLSQTPRCIMYLTGQHPIIPTEKALVNNITHVILAFMNSDVFNADETPRGFPLFTTVSQVRSQVQPGTKVMVAIGGWGDSKGFEQAAKNDTARKHWARQVSSMVNMTGADGVDIDWEYPGGNRDDYKKIPNSEREWEIGAFVLLLRELRAALGDHLISIAVPGLRRDMMAFTAATLGQIIEEVDFINVMTYDLMNRRDTVVKHHSGVNGSHDAVQEYINHGAPPAMLNLGLGYYVKAFMTQDCDPEHPLGCPTQLLEDPKTGADLGKAAGFSWHDKVPAGLGPSFARSQQNGRYFDDGSFGFWDAEEKRWWSYDTPAVIKIKVLRIVGRMDLGGVFAWGLGEDAPRFEHLRATVDAVQILNHTGAFDHGIKDEL